MARNALPLDPLDELRLVARPTTDRLPAMLFLAALIHGVLIIGIAFNPALSEQFEQAISLDVTLVADTDQHIDRPDDAAYLAQASQEGGGNTTAQVRPSAAPENSAPIDNLGIDDGNAFVDSAVHDVAADEVLTTRQDVKLKLPQNPRREPQPEQQVALALEKGSAMSLPLPEDERATLQIHDDQPRQLVISADTRESNVALYLDQWKRRIESVGEMYFPELGELNGITGSPTLEVSINASGELADVVIRKSSGSAVLDQAALDILRRASPFDPFPAAINSDYDSLRFAYKWLFAEDMATSTARVNTP
ncbi:MAG TPA: TonB family protein [Woeseiaceae bacterium]|nr:TonB family protein [Woeseiaceae bacterium]